MKFKTIFGATGLLLALFVAAFAADVDGKWTGQVQGPQGAMDITIVLKAEGEKLTGTYASQLGEAPIKEGSIKGDAVAVRAVEQRPAVFGGERDRARGSIRLARTQRRTNIDAFRIP